MRLVLCAFTLVAAGLAHAETIQAPVGGKLLPVGRGVVCEEPEGWVLESEGRAIRARPEARVGQAVEAKFAPDGSTCADATATLTLVATAPWPEIDPLGILFAADEGWLELKGERLDGLQLFWQAGERAGDEVCVESTALAGRTRRCVIAVERGLPTDAGLALRWLPGGARREADVATYDGAGRRVSPRELELRPARVSLTSMLPPAATVDLTGGSGRIPLLHPEAVSAVDCGSARCELVDGAVLVRSVPNLVSSISVTVRLAPRIYFARGDSLETSQTTSVAVLHCPIALASGAPMRDVDDARVVVRVDARCARTAPALRWTMNGDPSELLRVEKDEEAAYLLLRVGRVEDDRFNLVATRPEPDSSVVAALSGKTMAAPQIRASIELTDHGKIDFVPTNRDAQLRVVPVGDHGKLVPLDVKGAYDVRQEKGAVFIRGDENAAGFVSLRFGYRVDTLPQGFLGTDLAVLTEPLQRPVREASVPAAIGTSALTEQPLIELICADAHGQPQQIRPGAATRITFEQRDSCRVVVHRERLKPEEGAQDVTVDISVAGVDGTTRPDSHVSERMILRPAKDSRVFWIRGVKRQFDRITVRVAHVIDESHYMGASELRSNAPSVQWAVVVGGGHLRLYATTTIPTGLYRLTEPRGILTLNFGVLSRLTWLDSNGHEGLLGLELGVMGVGLVKSSNFNFPPTLATLAGFGISIPLGNRGEPTQATVNLHAWMAYEFRGALSCESPAGGPACTPPLDRRLNFYFGPSISVGNVGTNL